MTKEERPFGRIALALSGGGYRAAAYHLGTFQVLERLGLLKDVAILSTASGGSIVGARYVQSLLYRESFGEFVESSTQFLKSVNVVAEALTRVTVEGNERGPSLIRAAASVYSDRLFKNVRWSEIRELDSHLREIVINATEFENGLAFRFQRSDDPQAAFGNKKLRLSAEVAGDIRLADSVAASSCFPGAFEPMEFPHDFSWSGPQPTQSTALMDGGIYDNQAIEAALRANDRSPESIGLLVISDTDRKEHGFLPVRTKLEKRGVLKLWHARVFVWVLFVLAALSALVNAKAAWERALNEEYVGMMPAVAAAVVGLVVAGTLFWLRGLVRQLLAQIPFPGFELWPAIRRLTVLELVGLVDRRVRSLIAVTAGVFSKRVRDLVLKATFIRSIRKNIVASLIYSLDDRAAKAPAPGLEPPSEAMRTIVKTARATGTTLWFSPDMPLEELIACGRFTFCATLLRMLADEKAGQQTPEQRKILDAASALWKELVRKPLAWH